MKNTVTDIHKLTTNGKGYGNRLILAILFILKFNSTKEEPLSISQIGKYLYGEQYKASKGDIDKSLQRALLEFNNVFERSENLKILFPIIEKSNYQNKRSLWELYYDNLSESELNILLLALQQCNYLGDYNIETLIKKVIDKSGVGKNIFAQQRLSNTMLDEVTDKYYLKNGVTDILANMDFLYNAIINGGNKITFSLYGYDRDAQRVKIRENYTYKVSPIHLAVHQDRFWLLAITQGHTNISLYPIDLIGDLKEVTDEPAEFMDIDKKKFLREHMDLSYDEPRVAYLKFHKSASNLIYTRIYNTFGNDFEYVDHIAEKLGEDFEVIRIKRSPYGLINWIFSNCAYISFVLDPELVDEKDKADTQFIADKVNNKLKQLNSCYKEEIAND